MKIKMGVFEKMSVVFSSLERPSDDQRLLFSGESRLLAKPDVFLVKRGVGDGVQYFDLYKDTFCIAYFGSNGHVKVNPINNLRYCDSGTTDERVDEVAKAYRYVAMLSPINVCVHGNMITLATKNNAGKITFSKPPATFLARPGDTRPTKKEIEAAREEYVKASHASHISDIGAKECDSDGRPA